MGLAQQVWSRRYSRGVTTEDVNGGEAAMAELPFSFAGEVKRVERRLGAGGKGRVGASRDADARGKRTATKKATEIAEASVESEEQVRKAPRPHQCRQYARKRFAEELPAIFDRFAKGARDGDVVCLKALIGLSGYDKEETHVSPRRRGRSFSKILLDNLRRHPPRVAMGSPENAEKSGPETAG